MQLSELATRGQRRSSELADDGADDRLTVAHLLDAHLLERFHQLALAVGAARDLLRDRNLALISN